VATRAGDDTARAQVATIEVDGKYYAVSVRISYDGVEYLGRLWFGPVGGGGPASPDRGVVAGRSRDDVIAQARTLSMPELIARFRRAIATKRRYIALRRVTDEILNKIRYLNQLAISMRGGLIDIEGAAQEIDLTEHQLHELVTKLRTVAGVEDAEA
jgi:hypothetical protein